jgi:branched-chain amino acid transport system ATP-binding protein
MLEARNIGFHVNGLVILRDVTVSVGTGEIVALIGPNGSGKTTLFNVIGGFLHHTSGQLTIAGRRADRLTSHARAGLGLGRLWQDVRVFRMMTCLENLMAAEQGHPGEQLWKNLLRRRSVQQADRESRERAEYYLSLAGLAGKAHVEAENLSFGQQKLLALCRLFMSNARILLLDEPYAGVNTVLLDQINALLDAMKKDRRSLLIIEHNIALVSDVAERMYALDEGSIIAHGSPGEVVGADAVREAYAGI